MRQTRRPLHGMVLYSTILSQLVGSLLIGVFTGMWLDNTYGTTPVFLVIGVLIGLLVSMFALVTTIRKYDSGD
ncbi:AtpZ/AtpI family protein [Psychrobacillus sp.]|uniref:AtpZ/AtpI family protein n=1 Tax=Psychrobacillus sp. TaxID=1871623 RepID=UPI0028BF0827|nr:AtpZ/AtpI family protein [Psychrobacillus sp.]